MANVLSADRFTAVATEGLGRMSSDTAGSMVHFRGGIYVGTSCANPVGRSDAPRIFRYDIKGGTWSSVYESPLIDPQPRLRGDDHQSRLDGSARRQRDRRRGKGEDAVGQDPAGRVPRDSGYQSMCVFQGKSDRSPALYVSTMSRTGAILLRSEDGEVFEPVAGPGFGDASVYSFRSLVESNGWLFVVPAGTVTDSNLDRNLPPEPKIYVSNDPLKGAWLEAAKTGFGDSSNLAIYPVCAAFGRIYAGTANADLGCQLWQAEVRGKPPFDWSPVIVDGGGAFNKNFAVGAIAEFNNALYVGVGVTGFGFETTHQVGPASAELWRVYPDGRWDLIAGQMRFSANGLKVPLSLLGPGLGDFYNSMIRSMAVHDGVLYLGTYQWEAYRCLEIKSATVTGGYQLWASVDGDNWSVVLEDGNGSPADLGVASLLSMPHGLLVGTSNQGRLLDRLSADGATPDFQQGFKVLQGDSPRRTHKVSRPKTRRHKPPPAPIVRRAPAKR
jgi:hypothetical protein